MVEPSEADSSEALVAEDAVLRDVERDWDLATPVVWIGTISLTARNDKAKQLLRKIRLFVFTAGVRIQFGFVQNMPHHCEMWQSRVRRKARKTQSIRFWSEG